MWIGIFGKSCMKQERSFMKNDVKESVLKLDRAFRKLKEGLSRAKSNLAVDGAIKRFEFTFELLWKSLKLYLEAEGIRANSPRECFKAAFKMGIVRDEKVTLDLLRDRNKTAHLYHEAESRRVFIRIREKYAE